MVCAKTAPQPPHLCSPNPHFILFNQLRLFPDVITLQRYFPHTNVVSYPSGIMTHFSFQEQASVACSWVNIRAAGSLCLHPPGSTSDAAQLPKPKCPCGAGALFVLTQLQSRHGNTASPAGLRKAWKGQMNQILSWELGSPAEAERREGMGWGKEGRMEGGHAPSSHGSHPRSSPVTGALSYTPLAQDTKQDIRRDSSRKGFVLA